MKYLKALTVLTSILFFNSNLVFTQEIIWSDDFSDTSNWTLGNFRNNEANWSIDTVPPAFRDDSKIQSTTASNGFALLDSWGYTGLWQEAYIEPKETFDCSSFSNVKLEFQQFYADNYDSCIVQITNDNWETHENIFINEHVQPDFMTQNPDTVSLDISNLFDGKPKVHFAILFVHPHTEYGLYWMIDDIKLIGTPATSSSNLETVDMPEFSVFPVPANESLSIEARAGFQEIVTLRIVDISGKVILQRVVMPDHDNTIRLDVSYISAGIYFLSIQEKDHNKAFIRFIKN